MIHETIFLSEHFDHLKSLDSKATLRTYIPDNSAEPALDNSRPSVLILPGGGYHFTSPREAEPVALKFNAYGFNAFVLDYSTDNIRYPQQLLEASAAMALIRRNCENWKVISDKIAICGFSAGGHLACSLGTMWQEDFIAETLKTKKCSRI